MRQVSYEILQIFEVRVSLGVSKFGVMWTCAAEIKCALLYCRYNASEIKMCKISCT